MSVELLKQFDNFSAHRDALMAIAEHADEYAGIPCGIEGEKLVIHPSYRFAEIYKRKQEPQDYTVVNSWFSHRLNADVVIMRESDGRLTVLKLPPDPVGVLLRTAGCSVAWSIEAEAKAQQKLGALVRHHTFKAYLLTGSFIETSKRSKITYVFRRLRPTIALRATERGTFILAHLCLHPIGYYEDSFAGSMVPTDEVVAHLVLMRGDEHAFWKWSNQHRRMLA